MSFAFNLDDLEVTNVSAREMERRAAPETGGPSPATLSFLDDVEKGAVKRVRFPSPQAKTSQYMSLARTAISYKGFKLEKVEDRDDPLTCYIRKRVEPLQTPRRRKSLDDLR